MAKTGSKKWAELRSYIFMEISTFEVSLVCIMYFLHDKNFLLINYDITAAVYKYSSDLADYNEF